MIDYKRLEMGTPNDVELITDDSEAEMAALEEMIEETEFEINLPPDRDDDGKFHFIIPGEMVGEFAECVFEIDRGKLDELTDQWNREAVEAAEQNGS